ncbi:hypothetical protein Tco_0949978 [Tanacetum coccineum]
MELVLEQTQQGTSYEVSVSAEGVEELKRKVKIKGEKKEALLTLRQKSGRYSWIRRILKDRGEEFDIEIKDRKGTENVAANHLSRIEKDESSDDSEVDDNFPRETLMEINTKDEPWFADFANYLVADIIPKGEAISTKEQIIL